MKDSFNYALKDVEKICKDYIGFQEGNMGSFWNEKNDKKTNYISFFEDQNLALDKISEKINRTLLNKITEKLKTIFGTSTFKFTVFSILIKRKISTRNDKNFFLNCCPVIIGENIIDGYYIYHSVIKNPNYNNFEFYLSVIVSGIKN